MPRTVADEVRYYEQNGVTYRETKQVVQRPVCETKMQPTSQAVCREQVSTEYRDVTRLVLVPVTQYQYQTYEEGFWSPFGAPEYKTYLVPVTHWEQRTETVKVPLTCRRWVTQNETVQVPVATQRMVQQEVITRTAIATNNPCKPWQSASAAVPSTLQSPTLAPTAKVGGVARLDQDPPRQGTNTAWQTPAAPTR